MWIRVVQRVGMVGVAVLALASMGAYAAQAGKAPPALAAASPPTEDFADLQIVCGTCHTLALVTERKRTEPDWIRVFKKMNDIGLKGTEAQFDGALRYIRQNLVIPPEAAPSS